LSQLRAREVFNEIAQNFREFYVTAKSEYDGYLLNREQFSEGRLERDAFERSMTRINRYIIDAEFEIGWKILPQLRRVEKEILQEQIIEKVEEINVPEEIKKEVRKDAEKIQSSMKDTENKDSIDQVEEYIGIGRRILELGEKVWKFVKETAPVALPLISRIFGAS
jgi:hypothetical protein